MPKTDFGDVKRLALLCQRAENIFCSSPCGIMDQFVSAAASKKSLILLDCRSLEYETVKMNQIVQEENITTKEKQKEMPVFVICNSNVKHSIGGGEYPVRVKQCQLATEAL